MQRNPNVFYFDGQLHIPLYRVRETIDISMKSGLDALFFTGYGDTKNFDCISEDKTSDGSTLLGYEFGVEQISPVQVRIYSDRGQIEVLKAEEIRTRHGHLLAWG